MPGSGGSSNNGYTEPEEAPVEEPVEEPPTDPAGTPGHAVITCEKEAVEALTPQNAMGGAAASIYEYYYGVVTQCGK